MGGVKNFDKVNLCPNGDSSWVKVKVHPRTVHGGPEE